MRNNRHGFTIIEVVLVLAIAGLIFLMVFIALPALQRSQRNTRRRSDMARIATATTNYQAANSRLPFRNKVKNSTNPADLEIDEGFISHYIDESCTNIKKNVKVGDNTYSPNITYESCGDQFSDPDGTPYVLAYKYDHEYQVAGRIWVFNLGENANTRHIIFAHTHAKCDHDNPNAQVIATDGANDFALRYVLEDGAVYCVDNS